MAEWSRALHIILSDWCCSVSMVRVQIPSREEQNVSAQRSNSNTVWFNFQRTLDLMIITLFRNCKLIAITVINISNKSTKKMYMLYMYLLFHLLVVTCDILVDRVKRGSIILFWNGMNKRR